MVPGSDPLEAVDVVDLVGGLLVLWVALLAFLLTSGDDPATPPVWWGVVGLVLLLASVAVAFVLYRRTSDEGEEFATVWKAVFVWHDDSGGGESESSRRETHEPEYGNVGPEERRARR